MINYENGNPGNLISKYERLAVEDINIISIAYIVQ